MFRLRDASRGIDCWVPDTMNPRWLMNVSVKLSSNEVNDKVGNDRMNKEMAI